MKSIGILAWLLPCALLAFWACGSSDSGGSGETSGGGASAGAHDGDDSRNGGGPPAGGHASGGEPGAGEESCTSAKDCPELDAEPAGCAVARCVGHQCRYETGDGDGDGFASAACTPNADVTNFVPGDDCDDEADDVHPGAWDGPADPKDSTRKERCGDGIDQNCSGADGDDGLADGTTCTCEIGQGIACSETETGAKIDWPTGSPVGQCKRGLRECVVKDNSGHGKWGPCLGAVAPSKIEYCGNGDQSCEGNGETDAIDPLLWFYDKDEDGYGHKGWQPVESCDKPNMVPAECAATCDAPDPATCCPPGLWGLGKPSDCNDDTAEASPVGTEKCGDGIDNDCNGEIDEPAAAAQTWFYDGDLDGYVAANAVGYKQCSSPGTSASACPAGFGGACCPGEIYPCDGSSLAAPKHWLTSTDKKDGDDCKDNDATFHPNAWDGPELAASGIVEPGLLMTAYTTQSPTTKVLPDYPNQARVWFNASWGTPAGASAPVDNFLIRWTGSIFVDQAGTFKFDTLDGIDDSLGISIDGGAAKTMTIAGTKEASFVLTAGNHTIQIDFIEYGGGATAFLSWSGPGLARRPLAMRALPATGAQAASCDGQSQDCDATADDDHAKNGTYDAACGGACIYGEARACGDYGAGAPNVGICRQGTQRCSATGAWGSCDAAIVPKSEVCNAVDDDCHAGADDTYQCVQGASRICEACPGADRGFTASQTCSTCSYPACQIGNSVLYQQPASHGWISQNPKVYHNCVSSYCSGINWQCPANRVSADGSLEFDLIQNAGPMLGCDAMLGPYLDLPAGTYRADVNVMRTIQITGDSMIGVRAGSQWLVSPVYNLTTANFVNVNTWKTVSVTFTLGGCTSDVSVYIGLEKYQSDNWMSGYKIGTVTFTKTG